MKPRLQPSPTASEEQTQQKQRLHIMELDASVHVLTLAAAGSTFISCCCGMLLLLPPSLLLLAAWMAVCICCCAACTR